MKRINDICSAVDNRHFSFRLQPCLRACLAVARPVALTRLWSCSRLHELAPRIFRGSSARLRCWSRQWPRLDANCSRTSDHLSVCEPPRFVQTSLNNHSFVNFLLHHKSKSIVWRSIFDLNVVALFARIALEITEWWSFENHQVTLFGHAKVFVRRWSPFFFLWLL